MKESFIIKIKFGMRHIKKILKSVLKIFIFAVPIIVTILLAKELQSRQSINSSASISQANIFFQVNEALLPPETDFLLLVNTDSAVGFIKAEINFDPSLIKLTKSIDLSASPLKKVIKITSLEEANSTGKIEIVVGLEPSSLISAPLGNMQIASLSFTPNTQLVGAVTNLNISTLNSQVVGIDSSQFSIVSSNATLTLNSVSSTPSPSPIVRSCKNCQKSKCDGRCDTRRETSSCSDCL